MRTNRHQALREYTADIHERLHHQSPFSDINAGRFTAQDVQLMERLHEEAWAAYAGAVNEAAFQASVGLDPYELFGFEARAAIAIRPVDRGGACGVAYVFLGSKFGGAVLGRRLAEAGYLSAAERVRQRPADKLAWTRLLDTLEDLTDAEFQAALQEADHAFGAFRIPASGSMEHA